MARDGRSTKKESLSFFFSGCRPRFARLAASPLPPACIALTKSEEKERLLAVYKETQTELSFSKSTLSLSFPLLMNFFVLAMLRLSEEIRCFRVKDIKKRFMAIQRINVESSLHTDRLYSETCIKRTPSGNAVVVVRLIQGVRLIQVSIDNVI